MTAAAVSNASGIGSLKLEDKGKDVRMSNIVAAKAVADAVRTSLGPRGMDKMIQETNGSVVVTNDGATILKHMQVLHPTAKMLVELSKGQDIESGDGTTSVVVIAGALLEACQVLLDKGFHPMTIAEGFSEASREAENVLRSMSLPISLSDRDALINVASTSLNSKVVAGNADILAPIAVDAVLAVADMERRDADIGNCIRIVPKVGSTVDACELVNGLALAQKAAKGAGGPNRIENAKIGLIQFCLSPPKTDMEHTVTLADYSQMDRVLREERAHLAKMVKHIAKTGCNVLLVQKSILRDAVTNLSLDFLAKAKILVIRDIERDDVEFLSRILGVTPAATLETFTEEKLGKANLVREENLGEGLGTIVRFEGIASEVQAAGQELRQKCVSVLLRAATQVILEEVDRSLHDSLCVVRCLVREPAIIPGGAAPEMEMAVRLREFANTVKSAKAYCIRAFADALEVIPATLAENSGLDPLEVVTALRVAHAKGHKHAGINVKSGKIDDNIGTSQSVMQPLVVTLSAIRMATETVRMVLKIDDLVYTK